MYVLFTSTVIGGIGPSPTPGSLLDLYALSAGSGSQLWHQQQRLYRSTFSKPLVVNNVVCVISPTGFSGFQTSTGRQLWQWPTSPLPSRESLYGPAPGP